MLSIASVPRLRCQAESVSHCVQLTCIQCSSPLIRIPVSSSCFNGPILSKVLIWSIVAERRLLASRIQEQSVPSEIAAPHKSSRARPRPFHRHQMKLREIDGQGLHMRTILHWGLYSCRETFLDSQADSSDSKFLRSDVPLPTIAVRADHGPVGALSPFPDFHANLLRSSNISLDDGTPLYLALLLASAFVPYGPLVPLMAFHSSGGSHSACVPDHQWMEVCDSYGCPF